METELLILKSNSDYIRIKEDEYILCGLDKASVFPKEKLEFVRQHLERIRKETEFSPAVFKLTLREEPLFETDAP